MNRVDTFSVAPIPSGRDINGWQTIPIIECNEPLVSLRNLNPLRFVIISEYYRNRIPGAVEECYVREGLARLLSKAAKEMPAGWQFVIYDGWRPIKVQQSLYNSYYKMLVLKYPDKQPSELRALASKYVSLPSDDPDKPSPHNTGGAIDLGIRNEREHDLDMGSRFDDFGTRSRTDYFELEAQKGVAAPEDRMCLENRRILYSLMIDVGFTNYPEEWWHYDYGNQFWAKLNREQNAMYGAISL